MSKFELYTPDNAPEAKSAELLKDSEQSFGFIPNLHKAMSVSPQLLEGYKALSHLATSTSFTKEELTVVWISINVAHNCHYCVPAHSAIATMQKVDAGIIQALRNEEPLADAKLEGLRTFTLQVVENRGVVAPSDLEAFYALGYTNKQVAEVILVVGHKVMSNYYNHIAKTAVDEQFQPFAWQPVVAE